MEVDTLDVTRTMVYVQGNAQTQHQEIMIQSFACKKTQRLARGGVCHKDFVPFRRQAEKRLRVLDAASDIMDLMNLPSNHFEALRGKRQGYYSIRVNIKWRITFTWQQGAPGPDNVAIVDYH